MELLLLPIIGFITALAVTLGILVAIGLLLWNGRPANGSYRLPSKASLHQPQPATTMLVAIGPTASKLALRQLELLEAAGRADSIGSILLADLGDRHQQDLRQELPAVFADRFTFPSSAVQSGDFEGTGTEAIRTREPHYAPAIDEVLTRVIDLHLRRCARPPACIAIFLEPGADQPIAERIVERLGGRFSVPILGLTVLPPDSAARAQFWSMRTALEARGLGYWLLGDSLSLGATEIGLLAVLPAMADPHNDLPRLAGGQRGAILACRLVREGVPAKRARWPRSTPWVPRGVMENVTVNVMQRLDQGQGDPSIGIRIGDTAGTTYDALVVTAARRDIERIAREVTRMLQTASDPGGALRSDEIGNRTTRPDYRFDAVPIASTYDARQPSGQALGVRIARVSEADVQGFLDREAARLDPVAAPQPHSNGSVSPGVLTGTPA